MANKRSYNPQGEPGDRIVLEVRQQIGVVVPDKYGSVPMVVEAFKLAGEYLRTLPLGKDQPGAHVEFEYMGIKFGADAWIEDMVGEPSMMDDDQS